MQDRQGFFANHTQHYGPQEKGAGTQVEVREADRGHRSKDLGAGPRRSSGHDRIRARDRTQLTSGLPRLWPPVCQLGAMFRAQHAQPRGRSVHQRGDHSVRRGPGAGGQWLPHVTGKEKVRHRYTPTLLPCLLGARPVLGGQAPPLCFCQTTGLGKTFGVFEKDKWL